MNPTYSLGDWERNGQIYGKRRYNAQVKDSGDWEKDCEELKRWVPDNLEGWAIEKSTSFCQNRGTGGQWLNVLTKNYSHFFKEWTRKDNKFGRRIYDAHMVDVDKTTFKNKEAALKAIEKSIPEKIDGWVIERNTWYAIETSGGEWHAQVISKNYSHFFKEWTRKDNKFGKRIYDAHMVDVDKTTFKNKEAALKSLENLIPEIIDDWVIEKDTWYAIETPGGEWHAQVISRNYSHFFKEWTRKDNKFGKRIYDAHMVDVDKTTFKNKEAALKAIEKSIPEVIDDWAIERNTWYAIETPGAEWHAQVISINESMFFKQPWQNKGEEGGRQQFSTQIVDIDTTTYTWEQACEIMKGRVPDNIQGWTIDKNKSLMKCVNDAGIWLEIQSVKKDGDDGDDGDDKPVEPPIIIKPSKLPISLFQVNLAIIVLLLTFDKNDEEDREWIKYGLIAIGGYGIYTLI